MRLPATQLIAYLPPSHNVVYTMAPDIQHILKDQISITCSSYDVL